MIIKSLVPACSFGCGLCITFKLRNNIVSAKISNLTKMYLMFYPCMGIKSYRGAMSGNKTDQRMPLQK